MSEPLPERFLEQDQDEQKLFVLLPARYIDNFMRAEVNLERLPFFTSDKNNKGKSEHQLRRTTIRDGVRMDIQWEVMAIPRLGYPNSFDRDVYRAIQRIIHEDGLTREGYVRFSLYRVAKILGREPDGRFRTRVKESLQKIAAVTVQSRGSFYFKGEERWVEDTFHIFDRVVWKGQSLASGTVAETNYLKLGDWYVESMAAGYLKPVDSDYYFQLRNPIAKSLYGFLSYQLYVLPAAAPFYQIRYSELCDCTIMTRQQYPSDAKKVMRASLEELIATKFLARVEYAAIPRERRDFYIRFYRGERVEQPDHFKALPAAGEVQALRAEDPSERLGKQFYQKLFGRDRVDRQITDREREQVQAFVARYGAEAFQTFAAYVAEEAIAKKRFANLNTLSGALQFYQDEFLAKLDARLRAAEARHATAQAQAAKQGQRAAWQAAVDEFKQAAPPDRLAALRNEAEQQLLKQPLPFKRGGEAYRQVLEGEVNARVARHLGLPPWESLAD